MLRLPNPVVLLFCLILTATADDRPNILWITSEDNGPFLGCYGDPIARTPNLDQLAATGTRYTNFFANSPVCAAARNSWLFGTAATRLGTHHMRSDYRVPTELIQPYPVALRAAGYYLTNNSKTDYNSSSVGKDLWDECSKSAHYKNRPVNQPFFAVFNITDSHESKIFEARYPKSYPTVKTPAEGISIPPYQIDSPETRLDWQRNYDRISDMDAKVGKLIDELEQLGEADNTIIVYCSDHGGITLRSKRYLYDSGTRVPLIVSFPEKWRQLRPSTPGSASDRLTQFIDLPLSLLSLVGAAVPTQMNGFRLWGPQQEEAPDYVYLFSGRFDGSPDTRRGLTDGRWKYIRNFEPDRQRFQMLTFPVQQTGQVAQWKAYQKGTTTPLQAAYYQPQPFEELYDTANDPHEVNNLATLPKHSERLQAMRAHLDETILTINDAGFIPEPMMADIDQDASTSLYQFAQNREVYPLEQILKLASYIGKSPEASIPHFISALKEQDPILRYWAIVGLRSLGQQAQPALEAIEQALTDSSASVRINAAISIASMGQRDRAIDLLLNEAREAKSDAQANWALDGIKLLDAAEALDGTTAKEFVHGKYSQRIYDFLRAGGSIRNLAGESSP